MADPTIWQISDGFLGLKLVDPLAVGYLPTWQAPAGHSMTLAVKADYETAAGTWSCQVTSGAVTAEGDGTTIDVPAASSSLVR